MSCTAKTGLALLLPARAAGVSLWSSEVSLKWLLLEELKRS